MKKPTKKQAAKQVKKQSTKLGRVVKTYTVNAETAEFINTEFPNIKDGRVIDELVMLYKISKALK